ncbi:MAG: hypothetical protein EA351_09035 [Gemmatimonadales bacterium]|nr:MAG: hypothetical protein EA351_09035 [Gemmatimonadales bacterium]
MEESVRTGSRVVCQRVKLKAGCLVPPQKEQPDTDLGARRGRWRGRSRGDGSIRPAEYPDLRSVGTSTLGVGRGRSESERRLGTIRQGGVELTTRPSEVR